MRNSRLNCRRLSSHFIHLRVDGRSGQANPLELAKSCHCESLHVVTRHTQESAGRLATWPAQFHFIRLCSIIQSLTPADLAVFSALSVTRWIHGKYSSSGARVWPTILRNMALRAVFSSLNSSCRGVHEAAHHRTQLPTVASNSLSLFFTEELL